MHETELLITAIRERLLISFQYDDGERIVQPYILGYLQGTGNLAVSAYQVEGQSESGPLPDWRIFLMPKIMWIGVLDRSFTSISDYNPADPKFSRIIANV